MSREDQDACLAKILEEILVGGRFYRNHCHRCMFWKGKRGCTHNWHGCYYVQEELENRIAKAQERIENECFREDCDACPFVKHHKNCRLICTRTVLEKQGIHMREVLLG